MANQEGQEQRIKIQRLWCQHCKALQKTNETVVECWYNPLDEDYKHAFCAANCDAVDYIFQFFPQGDDEGLLEFSEALSYLKGLNGISTTREDQMEMIKELLEAQCDLTTRLKEAEHQQKIAEIQKYIGENDIYKVEFGHYEGLEWIPLKTTRVKLTEVIK